MERDRRFLHRRVITTSVALAALYLVLLTGERALDAYRINQEVESVRQEIAALQERNRVLEAELAASRADGGVERVARSDLGLVKPGDHPIVIEWPSGGRDGAGNVDPSALSGQEPNWSSWLRLFVDIPDQR
ncbi:MAG: hypothetical protein GEU73_06395 [Chloroflexi bacterium]|nr:hypothetical protein [Chloroflexota bacterium]